MRTLVTMGAMVLLAAAARGGTLWETSFDAGPGGWITAKDQAPAETQGETAKQGGALELDYRLAPETINGVVSPVDRSLRGARSVRFQLRTSHQAAVLVVLGEADEISYLTVVPSKPGEWHEIEISVDRFRLDDKQTDPNGKLDPGEVKFVGVVDASLFLGLADGGERTLWIDEFQVTDEEAANAYSFDGHLPYLLDDFQAGYHTWLNLAGNLDQDPDEGLLTWKYDGRVAPGGLPGIATMVGPLPSQATHLYLTLRSERAMTLAVVLQESKAPGRDESNYVTMVQLTGGDFETVTVELGNLQLDTENSSDENGRFDLDQVGSIMLADLELLLAQPPAANVVTLDEIELVNEG